MSDEDAGTADLAPPTAANHPVTDDGSTADPAQIGGNARVVRSAVAGLVGVVAVIGMVAGILGFWTLRTATDSDRFADRIERLLGSEEVSDALAERTATEVADALEIRAAVVDVVPEGVEPIVDLLLAGVRSRAEQRLAEVIRSPEVSASIGAAAGRAHGLAIDVIEGDDVVDGVDVADGEVRVNLLPLTARAIRVIQETGLFRDVEVPDLERGGDPDVQRDELAAALGRPLPDDFGEPVVFRSESLDEVGGNVQLVRDVLVLARRTFWLLLAGGLALAGLAIWLSAQRLRAATFVVAGLFGATLLTRLVVDRAGDRVPDAVRQPGARATVAELTEDLERSLNDTLLRFSILALLVLGLCLAYMYFVHEQPDADTG